MIRFEKFPTALWFDIRNHIIFLDKDGSFIGKPNDLLIKYFFIRSYEKNSLFPKQFKTLKSVFRYATSLLNKRKIGSSYSICACYLHSPYGLENEESLFHLQRKNDGFHLGINEGLFLNGEYRFQDDIVSDDERKWLLAHLKHMLPENWSSKTRKNEIHVLENKLYSISNIRQIIYRSSYDKETKIKFLCNVMDFYELFNIFLFVNKIPPVDLVFGQTKRWGGLYSNRRNEILLKDNFYFVIVHELFHHIDYTMIQENPIAINMYKVFTNELRNTHSMQNFISSYAKDLNEDGTFIHKGVKNSKYGKKYTYWTSPLEMIARFFHEYVSWHLQSTPFNQLSLLPRKDFSFAEVRSLSPSFEALLLEIGLWKGWNHDEHRAAPE